MSASAQHTARVETVESLSDWVFRVQLLVDGVSPFHFEPGQYISLHLPLHDGKEYIRHLSIASPPAGDNRIELCLTRSTTATLLDSDLPYPGEIVRFSGPKGSFRLCEPLDRDSLFIATGTGISPLRPMMYRALEIGAHAVTLLYGARTEADILYRSEFEALARGQNRFRYLPTLSRPDPTWGGLAGYVQNHLDHVLDLRTDLDVYVCGLKRMLEAVRPILSDRGFPREHVHYEKYD